jgi:hypothetical protein
MFLGIIRCLTEQHILPRHHREGNMPRKRQEIICETCPLWDRPGHVPPDQPFTTGWCRLLPRVEFKMNDDWCSFHPKFKLKKKWGEK